MPTNAEEGKGKEKKELEQIFDDIIKNDSNKFKQFQEIKSISDPQKKAQKLASVVCAISAKLESIFGIERFTKKEDSEHAGAVKSTKKLGEFLKQYPSSIIEQFVKNELRKGENE